MPGPQGVQGPPGVQGPGGILSALFASITSQTAPQPNAPLDFNVTPVSFGADISKSSPGVYTLAANGMYRVAYNVETVTGNPWVVPIFINGNHTMNGSNHNTALIEITNAPATLEVRNGGIQQQIFVLGSLTIERIK